MGRDFSHGPCYTKRISCKGKNESASPSRRSRATASEESVMVELEPDEPAEAIIVTRGLDLRAEMDEEHEYLIGEEKDESVLRVRYWSESDVLWFTWPNRPEDVHRGGEFEEQFNVLYEYLSTTYPRFGMHTR